MRTSRDQEELLADWLDSPTILTSRCLDKVDGGSIFSADRDRARGLESYLRYDSNSNLSQLYLPLYLVGTVPHVKELTSDKPLASNPFVVWRLTQGRTYAEKSGRLARSYIRRYKIVEPRVLEVFNFFRDESEPHSFCSSLD